MTVTVPTSCNPARVGASSDGSRWATVPTRRPAWTASSMRRTDEARPAPSGITACGNSTVPRSGSTARISGTRRSLSFFISAIDRVPAFSEKIDRTELPGRRANECLARWLTIARRTLLGAAVADVAHEVFDLFLHIEHPTSHL